MRAVAGLLAFATFNVCGAALPVTYDILALGGTNSVGVKPAAGLVLAHDGNYYGTTTDGGSYGGGTVFRFTPAGEVAPIASFSRREGNPATALIVGSDGHLYGTTRGQSVGASAANSTIYRCSLAGVLETLAVFPGSYAPNKLIQGSDGNFYGTTFAGGTQQTGSVFRMTPDGSVTTLVSFIGANGKNPRAGLLEGEDGAFYGTTISGGAHLEGTAFRVTSDGALTTLCSFEPNSSPGIHPVTELVRAGDGNFYGVNQDGPNSQGAAYRLTPQGSLSLLGGVPSSFFLIFSPLCVGADGNFYGATDRYVYRITPAGSTTVLATVSSARGPLLTTATGDLLGTTQSGSSASSAFGTIYRLPLNAAAPETLFTFPQPLGRGFMSELGEGVNGLLHVAAGDDLSSASSPALCQVSTSGTVYNVTRFPDITSPYTVASRTIQAPDGDSYGTIGVYYQPPRSARSTLIYRVTPTGSVFTVYLASGGSESFSSIGVVPEGGLTRGANTDLFGTMHYGANTYGTVYKITSARQLLPVAAFDFSTGTLPYGDLIFSDGVFYGQTALGSGPTENINGTFYSITPEGQITVLLAFPQDFSSRTGLTLANDGAFYGATLEGGANNLGRIFSLTKTGSLKTFASMDSSTGSAPVGVMQGTDGYFYGVTRGTSTDPGGIFRIDSNGTVTSLFRFDQEHGIWPAGNVMQASDGALYGATSAGGTSDGGVIYRVTLPRIGVTDAQRLETGEIRLQGVGVSLAEHSVRAAEELAQPFAEIGVVAADAAGKISFDDHDAPAYPRRFYRLVYP